MTVDPTPVSPEPLISELPPSPEERRVIITHDCAMLLQEIPSEERWRVLQALDNLLGREEPPALDWLEEILKKLAPLVVARFEAITEPVGNSSSRAARFDAFLKTTSAEQRGALMIALTSILTEEQKLSLASILGATATPTASDVQH